jgi:hypothetical protein
VPAELADHGGVAGAGGLVTLQEPGPLLLLTAQLDELAGGLVGLGHGHNRLRAGGPAGGAEHAQCFAAPPAGRGLRRLLGLGALGFGLALPLGGEGDPLGDRWRRAGEQLGQPVALAP